MSKNKNARPTVGAAGQAERESHWASGNSRNDYNAWSVPISRLLMHGAENAVSGSKIAESLGLELRDITREIERERQRGVAICAAVAGNERGYFLAQNAGELALYIRSLNRRIKNVQKTLRALDSTLADMEGQQEIDWGCDD